MGKQQKKQVTNRKPIMSITAKDFEWTYYRGSGKGGQKRNKTSNAARCKHPLSGAVGAAEDTRSQRKNKELAFLRCVESKGFKRWHRVEISRLTGELALVEAEVDKSLRKVKVEVKDESGRWIDDQE